jgi:gliding motility-associated-like protein
MIAAMHIPYVSAVFGNLSNSWSAGPFYLDYTVMESGFDLGLYNNQMLEFDPEMHGKLDFPALVDYEVVNPSTGAVIESGNDSVINYLPGQEIRIDFPCQYDFMDVIPSYSISNEFTNHTYDSIAFDFLFDMLAFNVGVEPLTVIPEICIPIYVPCGPWYCVVCDWCHDGDICTPEVAFDGFDFGFGPLVHWQPNLYNTSYDWVDNTWELDGFNGFEGLNAIRLEPAKFSVTSIHNNVLCHGEASGDASAIVSNGNPPYLYEWDNGESQSSHQTTHSVGELLAGTHYVSVTDANGCMVFTSFVVEEPIAPLSVNVDLLNPTCNGFSNGEITLALEGGTSPYNYVWSNGEITNNLSGLTAGEYTVTVTDANGCVIIESFVLIEPEELQIEILKQDVNCSDGNSGSLQAIVSGGITPYSYVWGNGETESQIQDLFAGTYNLTVTDFNGCTLTEAYEVLEPSEPLVVSPSIVDVLCNGDASGSISLEITGGTQPYVCNWYNSENIWLNETSGELTDLIAEDYSVNVTDANGCSEFLEINISEPDAFEYTAYLTHALCYGESTGAIELDLSGATPPYTYEWSNGETSEDLEEIAAGLYTLTITDANGCVYELQEEITKPDEPLVSEIVVQDVFCYGEKTGAISVETQGGTSPYTYLWNNGSIESSQNNIEAGIYTVTVTDGNGCQHYTGGEVNQTEAPLSLESVVVNAACFGSSNGQVELSINGGTLPYRIVWDDYEYLINNNLHSLSNLESGEYQVSVLDFNNCYINGEFVIDQPLEVSISFETGIVSCFGGEDGFANSSISGGTSPYAYQWSNGQTEENLINVSAGEYVLSIVDIQDCQYSAKVDIESMSEIEIAYEIKNKTCFDVDDASIKVFVSGGTEEYVYLWSNGAVSKDINDLAAGNYSLIVTDGNYCEQFVDVFIPESTYECLNIPSTFTPNGDGVNDTWILRNIFAYPDASVQVYTQTGQVVFESNGAYQPWDGNYNGEQLPAAVYYYIVNLNDGTDSFTGTVTILR